MKKYMRFRHLEKRRPSMRTHQGMVTAVEKISHLILLAGLCSLPSCVPQIQYVLVTAPKTWYEAQSYCRENYYDLATIDDAGEMERLLKDVKDKYDSSLWIGLRVETNKMWHWSLADKDFYKEGERNYSVWGNDYNCAYFSKGSLFTFGCSYKRYPLCFDGKKVGEEQYVVNTTTTMAWNSARDYCRKHHTDLASVRNEAESQVIQKITQGRKVWVGLFRDPWKWSDGTNSSFRYWRPSQPVYIEPGANSCAAVLKSESNKWGAKPCHQVHPFICQQRSTKVQIIKLRMRAQDSVLEQSNPAVEEDLLEQIRQQLGAKLGTETFRLSWNKHPDGRVFIKERATDESDQD